MYLESLIIVTQNKGAVFQSSCSRSKIEYAFWMSISFYHLRYQTVLLFYFLGNHYGIESKSNSFMFTHRGKCTNLLLKCNLVCWMCINHSEDRQNNNSWWKCAVHWTDISLKTQSTVACLTLKHCITTGWKCDVLLYEYININLSIHYVVHDLGQGVVPLSSLYTSVELKILVKILLHKCMIFQRKI